jgi:D-arabinose 1-dehydrogenase-like Zn-dependent alcohol dehydrogenase
MAEMGTMACWMGFGKGFELREYPVPDPAPGAVVIKVAIANVCGSDMHYWKGEQDYAKMGRPLPLNTGHEHMGTVHKLGAGVATDTAGQPLQEGDRVIYRYFNPCGRCKMCLKRNFMSCPTRQSNFLVSCEVWPHFQGGYGQYFYSTSARTTPSSRFRTRFRTRWRPASTAPSPRCTPGWTLAG